MNEKAGRNDPCPCGSGKKYKNCCWGKETKKTFTPAGKRRFKATVISAGAQAQNVFQQSASTQKMPDQPGSLSFLNKIKLSETDYRVEQEIVEEKKRVKIQPKKATNKPEFPDVFEMTEKDYRKEL